MPLYRIHEVVSGYTGAKTGKVYHVTPTALIEAPKGEFKNLPAGAYSLYRAPGKSPEQDSEQDKNDE